MNLVDKTFSVLVATMFVAMFYGMTTHNLPLAVVGIIGFHGFIFAWWKLTE